MTLQEIARNIIAESTSNEPGHKRMRLEEYVAMLAETMGALAQQQATMARAIEQAQARYGTVSFLANEVDTAPTPPEPFSARHVKAIPPGDWRSCMLLSQYNLNGNIPHIVMLDDSVFAAINATSPVVFPLFGHYETCSLAVASPSTFTGLFYLVFTNRELYVRT